MEFNTTTNVKRCKEILNFSVPFKVNMHLVILWVWGVYIHPSATLKTAWMHSLFKQKVTARYKLELGWNKKFEVYVITSTTALMNLNVTTSHLTSSLMDIIINLMYIKCLKLDRSDERDRK